MARDKGKGKVDATSGTKKRKTNTTAPSAPPLPLEQRFVDDAARECYTTNFISRTIVIEKPLVDGKVETGFVASLLARKWDLLIEVPDYKVNETMVREWYANLNPDHFQASFVMCRNMRVPISIDIINRYYGLGTFRGIDYLDAIHELNKNADVLETLREAIVADQTWTTTSTGNIMSLTTTDWPEDWKVILRFVQNRLWAKDNITHAGIQDLLVMYALDMDIPINVGAAIFKTFREHLTTKRSVGYPRLIHDLCLRANVPEYDTDFRPRGRKAIHRERKTGGSSGSGSRWQLISLALLLLLHRLQPL